MRAANAAKIVHRKAAESKSPLETLLKISSDSVFVLPEMLPPSIIVMPTSPEARASPRSKAARRVFVHSGTEMKKKVLKFLRPQTRAASSRSLASGVPNAA